MIPILMGVSGSGKSTVGRLLAERLGWPFRDADDDHPTANVAKMSAGVPLTDEDREPWLRALSERIESAAERGEDLVLACSALKNEYQDALRHDLDAVRLVWLDGSPELIARRLSEREGHFMDPDLLASQFADLEPPEHAVRVGIEAPPEEVVAEIRRRLGI